MNIFARLGRSIHAGRSMPALVHRACGGVVISIAVIVGAAMAVVTPPSAQRATVERAVKSDRLAHRPAVGTPIFDALPSACRGESWGYETLPCLAALAGRDGRVPDRVIAIASVG